MYVYSFEFVILKYFKIFIKETKTNYKLFSLVLMASHTSNNLFLLLLQMIEYKTLTDLVVLAEPLPILFALFLIDEYFDL